MTAQLFYHQISEELDVVLLLHVIKAKYECDYKVKNQFPRNKH